MKAWEVVGVCLAVAIGSAVGAALVIKDYLACEDDLLSMSKLDRTVHG